jgi:cell division protein FtsI/penicillin-binding protein 2
VAVTLRAFFTVVIATTAGLLSPTADPAVGKAPSLFAHTAQTTLDRGFPSSSVSYLLLDVHSSAILAERWANLDKPIPVGSLIKPFTAMAYAQSHKHFPAVLCDGARDSCWLPHGHGRLTLSDAIAQSCNAYFLTLAREVPVDQANAVFNSYSLPSVDAGNKSLALAGLSDSLLMSPLTLARAYARLALDARNNGDAEILSGMQGSARKGTARAVSLALPGRSALAKTGTARCTHLPPGSADGFTVLLYPADDPRLVLFVREHGVTGAITAATAAQMLRTLEPGRP